MTNLLTPDELAAVQVRLDELRTIVVAALRDDGSMVTRDHVDDMTARIATLDAPRLLASHAALEAKIERIRASCVARAERLDSMEFWDMVAEIDGVDEGAGPYDD